MADATNLDPKSQWPSLGPNTPASVDDLPRIFAMYLHELGVKPGTKILDTIPLVEEAAKRTVDLLKSRFPAPPPAPGAQPASK